MALMYVTEYAGLGTDPNGSTQAVATPPLVEQTPVAIGAAASSLPFGVNTTIVRIHVDAIASVNINIGGAATTSSGRMVAGQTEYFRVAPGQRANVITNT
jgi:hypothetical protein